MAGGKGQHLKLRSVQVDAHGVVGIDVKAPFDGIYLRDGGALISGGTVNGEVIAVTGPSRPGTGFLDITGVVNNNLAAPEIDFAGNTATAAFALTAGVLVMASDRRRSNGFLEPKAKKP